MITSDAQFNCVDRQKKIHSEHAYLCGRRSAAFYNALTAA